MTCEVRCWYRGKDSGCGIDLGVFYRAFVVGSPGPRFTPRGNHGAVRPSPGTGRDNAPEDIDGDAEFLTQPVSDDRTHELMKCPGREIDRVVAGRTDMRWKTPLQQCGEVGFARSKVRPCSTTV